MDHNCPAAACTASVPYDMLMCSRHWYMVPRPLQSAVWRARARGDGAGSDAHTAAIMAAIAAVNRALEAAPDA
jgi:hypothetical protein